MTDSQVDEIKAAKEKLMESAQKLFAKLYEAQQEMCIRDSFLSGMNKFEEVICTTNVDNPVSYTHLDVYKRQVWKILIRIL